METLINSEWIKRRIRNNIPRQPKNVTKFLCNDSGSAGTEWLSVLRRTILWRTRLWRHNFEPSSLSFLVRDDAKRFRQQAIEVAVAVGIKHLVSAHPLPFPNTSFTRELFFCRERSFEKEKQHRTIDDDAIASETKLTLADWGDHAQSIETGFFFHFTNGGLG